jgi:hypothetical protein
MEEKTIIIQMIESEENEKIANEAVEVLKKHFGESLKIVLPAFIKNPK